MNVETFSLIENLKFKIKDKNPTDFSHFISKRLLLPDIDSISQKLSLNQGNFGEISSFILNQKGCQHFAGSLFF